MVFFSKKKKKSSKGLLSGTKKVFFWSDFYETWSSKKIGDTEDGCQSSTLMVLSLEADTICLLSAEKATESTSLAWSSNLRSSVQQDRLWWSYLREVLPAGRSPSLMVLSQEPDRAKLPSEESVTSETKWPWPCSRLWGVP